MLSRFHQISTDDVIHIEGKIATSTSVSLAIMHPAHWISPDSLQTPNIVDNPSKQPSGGALADITIAQDVKDVCCQCQDDYGRYLF
jgi:hypothetical protein